MYFTHVLKFLSCPVQILKYLFLIVSVTHFSIKTPQKFFSHEIYKFEQNFLLETKKNLSISIPDLNQSKYPNYQTKKKKKKKWTRYLLINVKPKPWPEGTIEKKKRKQFFRASIDKKSLISAQPRNSDRNVSSSRGLATLENTRGIVDTRASIQRRETGEMGGGKGDRIRVACRCRAAINSKPYVRYNGELWGHVSDPWCDNGTRVHRTIVHVGAPLYQDLNEPAQVYWMVPVKGITTGKRISGIVSLIC